jgi:hypothetical protein
MILAILYQTFHRYDSLFPIYISTFYSNSRSQSVAVGSDSLRRANIVLENLVVVSSDKHCSLPHDGASPVRSTMASLVSMLDSI